MRTGPARAAVGPGDDARRFMLAEFATADGLLEAAATLDADGIALADAFTPFPLEALESRLAGRRGALPWLTLGGALVGATAGYFVQWYSSVVDYPLNVGGRPLHSWPAFLPVTFEIAVLGAALATFFGMLALSGLPRLHHPLFDAPRFTLASRDRFFGYWLLDGVDAATLRARLAGLGAVTIEDVAE